VLSVFTAALVLIALMLAVAYFWTRVRRLRAISARQTNFGHVARYRPMLRLLDLDDLLFLKGNRRLIKQVRKQRSQVFRAIFGACRKIMASCWRACAWRC